MIAKQPTEGCPVSPLSFPKELNPHGRPRWPTRDIGLGVVVIALVLASLLALVAMLLYGPFQRIEWGNGCRRQLTMIHEVPLSDVGLN